MKQTQTIPETFWFSSLPDAVREGSDPSPDKLHKKPQCLKRRSEFATPQGREFGA